METYLTVEEVAAVLKLSVQTIRRYVLKREIPYHKINGVAVRFKTSEIEWWAEHRKELKALNKKEKFDCVLFSDLEAGEMSDTGEVILDCEGDENGDVL